MSSLYIELCPKEFRERIAERIDLMGKNYGLKS